MNASALVDVGDLAHRQHQRAVLVPPVARRSPAFIAGWRARVFGQPRSSTPAAVSAATAASSAAPAPGSQSSASMLLQAAG